MTQPWVVRAGVVVPPGAMRVHAVRASGPGGQNVNKVASKVELRVDLDAISGLDAAALRRLRTLAGRALDSEGLLFVTSQATRDRRANLEDALRKVRALVLRALQQPRLRRPTRPTRGSNERRLGEKRRQGERKAARRGPADRA